MATTVDTLLVRIEADLKDVNRKLKQFDKNVDTTAKKAQRNFNKIGTAVKVVLGAVVVQQLAQAGMAAIKFASSVEEMQSKSSVVFGAFTQDVRNALSDFGDEVGRSTFELEGMASTIQDTFVPMGFARGEAAKLSVELTKLAVDVASFNNASDTETMRAFQSALIGNHETVRQFGIVITEATLQQELYRMGVTKNSKDVDNATKVQARMNLILKGTTDAHGDAARTSGSFANTSKALGAALDELLVNVVTPLLPALTKMVQGLADAAGALNAFLIEVGLIEQVGSEGADALELYNIKVKEVETLTKQAAEQVVKLNEAVNSTDPNAGHFIDGARAKLTDLDDKIKAAKADLVDLETMLVADSFALATPPPSATGGDDVDTEEVSRQKKIKSSLEDLSKANRILALDKMGLNEAEKEFQILQIELGKLTPIQEKQLRTLTREQVQMNKAYDAATKANDAYNTKMKEGQTIAQGFIPEQTKLEQQLENVRLAMRGAATEDLPLYESAIKDLQFQIKMTNPAFESLFNAAMQAADGISNALADAFVNGKLSLQSLGDIFKQVIKQMIADAIKAQIIKVLMSAFMGFAGGGSVGSGSSSMTFTSASDSFASGGRIPARAGGGPVLVGERGPELFIPHSGGVVRNNHDTKNMLGGGSPVVVNQNINIETGVAQTVRAEVMSMMPRIKSETIQAMIDGKRRGNSISKAFA
tara:strand:- start:826 stop:2940 length:2115 start_codon:yes stop_codon:yes gene_type:complete